jgi:hypothetical protein
MVDFWKYVWPTELPLQIIIGAIWALAIYVLIRCNGIRLKTSANLKMLEEMQDVSFLENVLKMNNVDVVQCFENFKMAIFNKMKTEGHPINKDTVAPLFEHLKAIYNAGYKSSRLDSDLLVKNTTNKIFRGIDTVRTLISLFLVVGILGTLVGLAMTITSLRVSSSAAGKYTLDLSNLGGAFAPSMWGVFCTIVFVAFFSVLIQEGCINRLTEKLTNSTINTWLPVLYPTDFQKSENSLVKLNETVKNAENINTGAQGLLRNLAESNETVVALREAANAVTETQTAFNNGASKFTEMKEALSAMQQQIREQNDSFLAYMANLASQNKSVADKNLEISNVVKDNYLAQSEKLEAVIHTLKMYDENFTEYRKNSEESLAKSIETNIALAQKISDSEEHLVKAIGDPLRQQLAAELQNIGNNIGTAATSLKQINNPLVETNRRMGMMFENFGRSFDELLDKLGAKAGLSDTERAQIISVGNNAAMSNAKVEEKLEAILQVLSSQEHTQPQIIQAESNDSVAIAKVEEKLSAILQTLRDQRVDMVQALREQVVAGGSVNIAAAEEKSGLSKIVQTYVPVVLAILLAISIGVQMLMVGRLESLEKSQLSVTEILQENNKKN